MAVHLLHVGKTGGTALKAALGPVAASHGLVLHRHRTRLADIPAGEGVAFALRDPVARFVSGFWSRQRQGRPRHHSRWSEGEAEAFARYPTPNALAEDLGSPEAARAMRDITHARGLREWFDGPAEVERRRGDIRMVLFQETLAADFEELKRRLGLPPGLALPAGDVDAHRSPPGLDGALSPLAQARLRDWFAEDMALVAGLRAARG